MKSVDPGDMDALAVYKLMVSVIVPRPIAFISTISESGIANLSPFSYFMGVSSRPPIVAVSIARGKDSEKDTMRNIRQTREFVVNIVTRDLAEPMVKSAAPHPPTVSEFAVTGLTPVGSDKVGPPRVKESPIHMECVVTDLVESPGGAATTLVLGRVLRFHVERDLWGEGEVDPRALNPLARLGGDLYATLSDPFDLKRPG